MENNYRNVCAEGYPNEYKVVKTRKRSWLNVFIINVGICLAVSLGVLLTKLTLGNVAIETFVKSIVG